MKELFNDYVQSLETYIMFKIKQEAQALTPELTKKNRKPIYLSMGAPVQAPPKFVIDKLTECLNEDGIHTYSTPKGESYFIEAVKERMKSRFGVELDTKTEICSLIGSKEGLANIIRELINPTTDKEDQEIIMVPDPGYASYSQMLMVSGGRPYPMPLTPENDYMPNLNQLWEKMPSEGFPHNKVKAMIINYPNNPLGAIANIDYYKYVVDFCKKHKILLISDAAYVDMVFPGETKAPSILEVEGAKDIAVEFHSFSKPYAMTGWRLGWVCGNAEAVGMFGKLKSTIDSGLFKALQKAGAAVLNSKEGDEYTENAVKGFQSKQKILVDGFKELGWDMDNLNVPPATFYLWLPIPQKYKKASDFTSDLLKTSGIVMVPGSAFGQYGEGYFRISIVASDDNLKEVISRMKEDGFKY
ncbi:MAG: aminotransferase class I/II-fold pyridoxal phosphate-dependent enzyme [Candidatus Gastranaerophilales bacterium]|nr:aminotransferase class I/II-fold pyridoxal phosphate-dependent enzyme [Candidatus Gastranaerophilales bacterium]